MAGSYMFVIVAKNDTPIYEMEHGVQRKESSNVSQFVVHAALDVVDELVWKNNAMNLRTVDKLNDTYVSTFVTAGHVRMMMLHDVKSDDALRNFFSEVYELYVKVLLNPFYREGAPITSQAFDTRVRQLAKKHLYS